MGYSGGMSTTERLVKIGGRIPLSEAEALESLAERNERSLAAELRVAVREHLKSNGSAARSTQETPPSRQT